MGGDLSALSVDEWCGVYYSQVPVVTFKDFERALTRAHSSVGADELQRFVEWTAEFGQEG